MVEKDKKIGFIACSGEKMEAAYNGLNQWIKDNGYEPLGPAIEFYFNNPEEVGMENAQTEIQLPLK